MPRLKWTAQEDPYRHLQHDFECMAAIDRELGIERAGGNAELARELFHILQDELKKSLETLTRTGDAVEISRLAHKLRSSARYCAAAELEAAAEDCELRYGDDPVARKTSLIEAIQRLLGEENPY